jgi:hypothetical protein
MPNGQVAEQVKLYKYNPTEQEVQLCEVALKQ